MDHVIIGNEKFNITPTNVRGFFGGENFGCSETQLLDEARGTVTQIPNEARDETIAVTTVIFPFKII